MVLGEGVAVLTSCSQVLHSIPKYIQLKSTLLEVSLLIQKHDDLEAVVPLLSINLLGS